VTSSAYAEIRYKGGDADELPPELPPEDFLISDTIF